MSTPLLFYSSNNKNNWRRVVLKLNDIFNVELNVEKSIEQFIEEDLTFLPNSLLLINCEKNVGKQDFVNRIRMFCSISFATQKVCIINRIDFAKVYVQNAILKNLENVENIDYLLTATNLNQITQTILSRVVLLEQKYIGTFEEKIIDIAINYKIELTWDDIKNYQKEYKTNKILFNVLKLKDEEAIKVFFLWQQFTFRDIFELQKPLTKDLVNKLVVLDRALNMYALGYFSKQVLLAEIYNGFLSE